jgi:ribosomal protein S18 acetylase RimI-like enzyme
VDLVIRKAEKSDEWQIWEIIQKVLASGDTYVFEPSSSKEKMISYWCGADKHTYVACIDDKIVGTFIIKENQPDLGSHVANASYMTRPGHSGKGIGRKMAEFSFDQARRLGFIAMQFNMVVKNNTAAVNLWRKMGFETIGEVPEAFRHPSSGLTGAYIMWKKL